MILDFRSLDPSSALEADLCIVGGGVAGIAIARELAGQGFRICLLESGGVDPEPETQALYRGENVGIPNFPLHGSRLRYLGGSSNHWEGWCGPLAEIDFEERPWIARSGWPFTRAELAPWYARANDWLGLGPFVYDDRILDEWRSAGWAGSLAAFDPERVRAGYWRFSHPPKRVGVAERAMLERETSLRVLLHANAIEFATDESGRRVRHVEVRSLDGRRGRVVARAFVLACGGLENPRLLLASRGGSHPTGLGNARGLVGRSFMDHFQVDIAHLDASDPEALALAIPNPSEDPGSRGVYYSLAPSLQRRLEVPNSSAFLGIAYGADEPRDEETVGALERLARRLGVGTVAAPPPASAKRRIKALTLRCFGEQLPNPDSRVSLGTERDALGMPRLRLDWRLTETDRRGLRVLAETLGTELARLGLARTRVAGFLSEERDSDPTWSDDLLGGHHPMGTTRMSLRPEQGVVDATSRVHGVANLFVAGSSVFPTAGHANPTLTLVALAMRLADHLKQELRTQSGER